MLRRRGAGYDYDKINTRHWFEFNIINLYNYFIWTNSKTHHAILAYMFSQTPKFYYPPPPALFVRIYHPHPPDQFWEQINFGFEPPQYPPPWPRHCPNPPLHVCWGVWCSVPIPLSMFCFATAIKPMRLVLHVLKWVVKFEEYFCGLFIQDKRLQKNQTIDLIVFLKYWQRI